MNLIVTFNDMKDIKILIGERYEVYGSQISFVTIDMSSS
jgi:hypothetical protein